MNKLGLVGGIGPESTGKYYSGITRLLRERTGESEMPGLIIDSIDLHRAVRLTQDDLDGLENYLRQSVECCARGGATFAALTACTAHIVFDELQRSAPIPLCSIVECTREHASSLGLRALGLFGTSFTMKNDFFHKSFESKSISIFTPTDSEQTYIHEIYYSELVKGLVRRETKCALQEIALNMQTRHGIDGLILGGTELSLILSASDFAHLPVLDTLDIHTLALTDLMLSDQPPRNWTI